MLNVCRLYRIVSLLKLRKKIMILIHLLVIFTRLSPFYRRVYSDSSFVFIFIVLSIISTILLFALLNTQIKDHDGWWPLGWLTLFHIIAVPLSFISFILYTFVYSILKKNIYSILFYWIIGWLYYLAETTKSETVTIIWFGIILIGIYYVIFHLLLYLFDNKDFRE